jgi:TolA-binding protein
MNFTFPSFNSALVVLLCCFLIGCHEPDQGERSEGGNSLELGLEYLRVFNFDDAYQALNEAKSEITQEDAANWNLVTYSLALAAWHQAPPSSARLLEARSLLDSIIEFDSGSVYAASAMLDIGRILEVSNFIGDEVDLPAAQSYYRRVHEEFPQTDMACRAVLYLAQSMAQTFDLVQIEAAVALLEAEMDAQADSPWLGTMAQYTAQLYAFYLDEPQAALKPYAIAMDAGFPRSADTDMSLWQLALLAETSKEYAFAAEVFARLLRDYPRSIYATISRDRLTHLLTSHPEVTVEIPEPPKSLFNLQTL